MLDVFPWRTEKYDVVDYVRELPRLSQRERAAALQQRLVGAISRTSTPTLTLHQSLDT